MNADVVQEVAVGKCLIRLRSVWVESSEGEGWIGAWEVYLLPWHRKKRALYAGETGIERDERLAVGMARAIATATAFVL